MKSIIATIICCTALQAAEQDHPLEHPTSPTSKRSASKPIMRSPETIRNKLQGADRRNTVQDSPLRDRKRESIIIDPNRKVSFSSFSEQGINDLHPVEPSSSLAKIFFLKVEPTKAKIWLNQSNTKALLKNLEKYAHVKGKKYNKKKQLKKLNDQLSDDCLAICSDQEKCALIHQDYDKYKEYNENLKYDTNTEISIKYCNFYENLTDTQKHLLIDANTTLYVALKAVHDKKGVDSATYIDFVRLNNATCELNNLRYELFHLNIAKPKNSGEAHVMTDLFSEAQCKRKPSKVKLHKTKKPKTNKLSINFRDIATLDYLSSDTKEINYDRSKVKEFLATKLAYDDIDETMKTTSLKSSLSKYTKDCEADLAKSSIGTYTLFKDSSFYPNELRKLTLYEFKIYKTLKSIIDPDIPAKHKVVHSNDLAKNIAQYNVLVKRMQTTFGSLSKA